MLSLFEVEQNDKNITHLQVSIFFDKEQEVKIEDMGLQKNTGYFIWLQPINLNQIISPSSKHGEEFLLDILKHGYIDTYERKCVGEDLFQYIVEVDKQNEISMEMAIKKFLINKKEYFENIENINNIKIVRD